jgi:cation:H+ antiporter
MLVYILFFVGLIILVKGADFLVDGAASIAKGFNVSNISIGLTVVAFGTSMPEFVVSVMASINGNTEIAIGNILGSNIFNILFIIGLSAIIMPLTTLRNTVWKEIPMSLLAALLVGIMANDIFIDKAGASFLSRIDGLVLICFFIIFLYYTFGIAKASGDDSPSDGQVKILPLWKSTLFILLGLAGLIFGGKWMVDGAVKFANSMGVSESLIGLTIVAVGTSLPELATSVVAAYKKQMDIAIGNVVGSNIFNIFWILGISAVVSPLPFQSTSNTDIFMTIFASLLLFVLLFIGKRHIIQRWQGAAMFISYVAYVGYLIANIS